jgi:hypothetical protein
VVDIHDHAAADNPDDLVASKPLAAKHPAPQSRAANPHNGVVPPHRFSHAFRTVRSLDASPEVEIISIVD